MAIIQPECSSYVFANALLYAKTRIINMPLYQRSLRSLWEAQNIHLLSCGDGEDGNASEIYMKVRLIVNKIERIRTLW